MSQKSFHCVLHPPVQHCNTGWISELLSIQATKCRHYTVDRKRCEIVVLLQSVSAAFYPKTMIRWANPTVFETFTTRLHTYTPWKENSTCHSSSNYQFSIEQWSKPLLHSSMLVFDRDPDMACYNPYTTAVVKSSYTSNILMTTSQVSSSLKLTVRTWTWAGPQKKTIVFQPSISRCELSVFVSGSSIVRYRTVYGWNPAPPAIYETLWKNGIFSKSQLLSLPDFW